MQQWNSDKTDLTLSPLVTSEVHISYDYWNGPNDTGIEDYLINREMVLS